MIEFVRLEYKNSPPGSAELSGHQEVIRENAEKGYEYVGFIRNGRIFLMGMQVYIVFH